MHYPKMIIFDFDGTLVRKSGFDPLSGHKALFNYIKSNKNEHTISHVNEFSKVLYKEMEATSHSGAGLKMWQFYSQLYEYLQIELSIPDAEAETVFWRNAFYGEIMPNAGQMIDYINSKGIRSAIISSIGCSVRALKNLIGVLFPNNRFEFILSETNEGFSAPDSRLLEHVLDKTGLAVSDIWYCGDNIKTDVEDAAKAGIYPIWFENLISIKPWDDLTLFPKCKHLHIHDWSEFIEFLGRFQS